jgi:hypothetical protein
MRIVHESKENENVLQNMEKKSGHSSFEESAEETKIFAEIGHDLGHHREIYIYMTFLRCNQFVFRRS